MADLGVKRAFVNISGQYVAVDAIVFAKQKGGNEVVIYLQGCAETVTVGKEYWQKLAKEVFALHEPPA